MSVEIRYADQSLSYRPDPGRVLFSGGEWQIPEDQRPANWREREQVKHDPPPPKRVQRPSVPGVRTLKRPDPPKVAAPVVVVAPEKKVRTVKIKAPVVPAEPGKPRRGRPGGTGPTGSLSVASILDQLANGRKMAAIGADCGCGFTAISQRLLRHATEAELAQLRTLKTCACGKPKYPAVKTCYRCRRISKRPLVKKTSGPKPKCLCGACQLCRTRECSRRIRARKAAQR